MPDDTVKPSAEEVTEASASTPPGVHEGEPPAEPARETVEAEFEPAEEVAPEESEPLPGEPEEPELAEPVFSGLQGIDTAQVWIAAFLIVMVGALAYSRSFGLPIHFESQRLLFAHPGVQDLRTVPDAAGAAGYPVVPLFTMALNWVMSGTEPSSSLFHATNVFLHLLNGILVYLFCRRLLRRETDSEPNAAATALPEPIPMAAGLIAVVHPLTSEAVNEIAARDSLLLTALTLLSTLFLLGGMRGDQSPAIGKIITGAVLMIAGWGCGTPALLVPVFVLLGDWIERGGAVLERLRLHATLFALAGLLAAASAAMDWAAAEAPPVPDPNPETSYSIRAAAVARATRLLAQPIALTVEHYLPSPVLDPALGADTAALTTGISILGLLALGGIALALQRSAGGVALLWLAGGLLWAAWPVGFDWPFRERAVYFAVPGLGLLSGWILRLAMNYPLPRVVAGFAAAAIVLASGAGVYMRTGLWQDELELWEDALVKAPESPLPPKRMGMLLAGRAALVLREADQLRRADQGPAAAARQEFAQQLLNQAEARLRQAYSLDAADAEIQARLGVTIAMLGKHEEAAKLLEDSLRADPMNFEATLELARVWRLRAAGPQDRATLLRSLEFYERAERMAPMPPDARVAYATTLASLGQNERAAVELARLGAENEASPLHAQFKDIKAAAELAAKYDSEAAELRKSDPTNPEGIRREIEAVLIRGKPLQAFYMLDRYLQLHPESVDAWVLLGTLLATVDEPQTFLAHWSTPPAVAAGANSPWLDLVRRCAAAGRWRAAEEYLVAASSQLPEITMPRVLLADIALELNAPERANALLEQAAAANPQSPTPLLKLCDIAISRELTEVARRYLDEAEKRGADPAEVARRREKVGAAPEKKEEERFETILR